MCTPFQRGPRCRPTFTWTCASWPSPSPPKSWCVDASEVSDVRWFTLEQALTQADDASLQRLLRKARPYLGLPPNG